MVVSSVVALLVDHFHFYFGAIRIRVAVVPAQHRVQEDVPEEEAVKLQPIALYLLYFIFGDLSMAIRSLVFVCVEVASVG